MKCNVEMQTRLAELKVRDERRKQEQTFLKMNLEEFTDQTDLINREQQHLKQRKETLVS